MKLNLTFMETPLLYNKKCKSVSYLCSQRKNSKYWFQWVCFYFDVVVRNSDYLSKEITNDANLLFPDMFKRVLSLKEAYEEVHPNHIVAFFETFRNNYMQKVWYNQGVSNIKAYGMHNFSIAVDLINYANGRIKWNLDYDLVTKLAPKVGLYSLSPYEVCHLQLIPKSQQNEFRSWYFEIVKSIQDIFNVKIDGFIGNITQGAVLMFYNQLKAYLDNEFKLLGETYGSD